MMHWIFIKCCIIIFVIVNSKSTLVYLHFIWQSFRHCRTNRANNLSNTDSIVYLMFLSIMPLYRIHCCHWTVALLLFAHKHKYTRTNIFTRTGHTLSIIQIQLDYCQRGLKTNKKFRTCSFSNELNNPQRDRFVSEFYQHCFRIVALFRFFCFCSIYCHKLQLKWM